MANKPKLVWSNELNTFIRPSEEPAAPLVEVNVEQVIANIIVNQPSASPTDLTSELDAQLASEQPVEETVREERDEPEERKRAAKPEQAECSRCQRWFSPEAGLPGNLCSHCYEQERPSSANGTPFDAFIKEQTQTNTFVVYSPTMEDIREFFNLEVEGHGVVQDDWFVQNSCQHKYQKAVKDCTVEEIAERIREYEKHTFEMQNRLASAKIHIRRQVDKATAEQQKLIKSVAGETPTPKEVRQAKEKRAAAAKKPASPKSALEGLRALYAATGLSEQEIDAELRKTWPAFFEKQGE